MALAVQYFFFFLLCFSRTEFMFFPPPSDHPGWGQSSERGQDSTKPGNAFGECVRQKPAPARLLLLVPRLCGRAGFHIPHSSQTKDSSCITGKWMRRLGFLVGANSGWTWWCENPSSVLPGADNLCCGVWLLSSVGLVYGCWTGVHGGLFHHLILAPGKMPSGPGKKLKASLVTVHPGVQGTWQVSLSLG